jgi:hypothetical protein
MAAALPPDQQRLAVTNSGDAPARSVTQALNEFLGRGREDTVNGVEGEPCVRSSHVLVCQQVAERH